MDFVIIRVELQSLAKIFFRLIVSFQTAECMTKEQKCLRSFIDGYSLAEVAFSHGPATELAIALRDHTICLRDSWIAFCDSMSNTNCLFPFTFLTK